jgi:hypothetical protein
MMQLVNNIVSFVVGIGHCVSRVCARSVPAALLRMKASPIENKGTEQKTKRTDVLLCGL